MLKSSKGKNILFVIITKFLWKISNSVLYRLPIFLFPPKRPKVEKNFFSTITKPLGLKVSTGVASHLKLRVPLSLWFLAERGQKKTSPNQKRLALKAGAGFLLQVQ